MKIDFSSNFLKKSKKLTKKEKVVLSEKIEIFRKDPFDPRLKTHPLKGRLKGMYSFSLTYSKRTTFVFVGKNKILFINVGSHGEVYR